MSRYRYCNACGIRLSTTEVGCCVGCQEEITGELAEAVNPRAAVGKVVRDVHLGDDLLRIGFTDNTVLHVTGVWHNDDTAGVDAFLSGPDASSP